MGAECCQKANRLRLLFPNILGGLKRCWSKPVIQIIALLVWVVNCTLLYITSPARLPQGVSVSLPSSPVVHQTQSRFSGCTHEPWTATDLWLHLQVSELHKGSTRTPTFIFYSLCNLVTHYSYSHYLTFCREFHIPACMRFWSKNSQSNQLSLFNPTSWSAFDLRVDVTMI